VGRWEEATVLWGHALEATPDDGAAFERLHALLLGDLEAEGRALLFDRVLTLRLTAATLDGDGRARLLFERALHRLERLGDAAAASQDFKRILKIDPQHIESLWRLARLALETGLSLWGAIGEAICRQLLPPRALSSLKNFQQLIEDARAMQAGTFTERLHEDAQEGSAPSPASALDQTESAAASDAANEKAASPEGTEFISPGRKSWVRQRDEELSPLQGTAPRGI